MRFQTRFLRAHSALLLFAVGACTSAPPANRPSAGAPAPGPAPAVRRPAGIPAVPPRAGALAIDVVYPTEGQTLAVRDSNFIFGNVGTGQATVTIDGVRVDVAPNGAFLAFLPVPTDGRYDVQATAGGQTAQAVRTVRFPGSGGPAAPAPPRDTTARPAPPSPEAPRVAVAASSRADRLTVGTAVPGSGTPYTWFFPPSTRLTLTGLQGSQYRVRLTNDLTVWVDTAEVDLLPAGTAAPSGYVSVVTATPQPDYVDIRLGTSDRLPFQVEGRERGLVINVYGAETRTNILQYGRTDPLIERLDWEQVSDDLYRVTVDLSEPLWGFQPFWDERGNLIVRVNRTPNIDRANPLRGIHIVVDPGHPPGGAIGPTRLTEAEATLAVANRLVPLLRARGAQVTQLRTDMTPSDVNERSRLTTAANPDLFVSIHFDAFGDGTNPFRNYGTHVLFNQPQSVEFARAMQPELLQTFGLPDLGIRRQDVAVIRNPSMPAILTETMFMMFPEQEAALRNPESLQSLAEAHLRGIEAFLRSRAK